MEITSARDGTQVLAGDPHLEPYSGHLKHRFQKLADTLKRIDADGGGLEAFSRGYESYGFNRSTVDGKAGILYKEWAPGAQAASLIGDFNGWNADAHTMTRDDFGTFSVFIPDKDDGSSTIGHDSYIKVSLVIGSGERVERVPAWVRYAVLDEKTSTYCGKYWCPPPEETYTWKHPRPHTSSLCCTPSEAFGLPPIDSATSDRDVPSSSAGAGAGSGSGSVSPPPAGEPSSSTTTKPSSSSSRNVFDMSLRIYEAHVGMATQEERVGTYLEFAKDTLPRVKDLGYNCVQLMAIMEHAYYGSFGYHVTNFFAASSRFGTPEQLKELVDTAHGMGLLVIMDMVHSHASKNVNDGINRFDGTGYQYFHDGARGDHPLWDSRLFDYSKFEVQRFLLSNLRYYIEEFRFDGYRFDGVTSMLYSHHGMGVGFSGGYHEYFGDATDVDAVVYLMLANHLLHSLTHPVITIAEDVSGMPVLCRPVWEGGVGFDFRLSMAIPDVWIKMLKEQADDEWNMGHLVHTLLNRRFQERTITYAESHDQALVGDKTLAFRLMDKEMYDFMSNMSPPSVIIDRGMALHKMIRLLTYALGGEGYLNFMGNEFGHPEWIDFPREGNGWSYWHCRRQWNVVDDKLLKYHFLNNFDRAMHGLEDEFRFLANRESFVSLKHEEDKMIVFDKAGLVFVFNFHPTKSFTDYKIGAKEPGRYKVVLDSDWAEFGGHSRSDRDTPYDCAPEPWHDRPASFQVYSPSRTVMVYKKEY